MNISSARRGGRRGGLTLLALVAAVAGIVLITVAVRAQTSPPEVPASAAGKLPSDSRSTPGSGASSSTSGESSHRQKSAPRPQQVTKPLPPSRPVSISIDAIGVSSDVFSIGKAPDGALAVPAGRRINLAAWFENSSTPGQPGPSVIEGHVDTVNGPSVFYDLGNVRPKDKIIVERRDGITVEFTVDAVRDFAKSEFPTELVYGGDATPTLRLITCSDFDTSLGTHTGNEVVFAHLTDVRGA